MTAPTIRLATSEDLRLIASQILDLIKCLPFLYIATAVPDFSRTWGVAGRDRHTLTLSLSFEYASAAIRALSEVSKRLCD
jgi:hypothetical protein